MSGAAPPSADRSASPPAKIRPAAQFATTRWSVVLLAGRPDGTDARAALTALCHTYWFPLYAHARRRGYSAHDAEDLTQEFFARLLARRSLAHADPGRGRFRTFMLTAMNHFLADEWSKARALKRGGEGRIFSFDSAEAESRYGLADAGTMAPDRAFDREWALALLRSVLAQLEDEFARDGKAEVFAVLKPTLTGARDSVPYAEFARRLGRNENAVKVAVHRLRQRYRALLRAAIADTVASPDDAGAELRLLLEALRTE
jgi:RNA polymerase sigma-70 factor (ECF subfamily)